MLKNLRYSLHTSEEKHPQLVMRELGISYMYAVPQSLYESWHFWGCVNVPVKLPPNISEIKTNPRRAIGHGLTEKQANSIIKRSKRVNP